MIPNSAIIAIFVFLFICNFLLYLHLVVVVECLSLMPLGISISNNHWRKCSQYPSEPVIIYSFLRKGVKFVYVNIFAIHAFCTNHRLCLRMKRSHRLYNSNCKDSGVSGCSPAYILGSRKKLFVLRSLFTGSYNTRRSIQGEADYLLMLFQFKK